MTMDRARLERQMRDLALDHAGARIDDAGYLARMARLREQLETVETRRRTTCRRGGHSNGSMPSRKAGRRPT